MAGDEPRVITERDGHVLVMTLNRADKLNAFDRAMLDQLSVAFTEMEDDPAIRCGVLLAKGRAFTAGLDLGEVGPAVRAGEPLFPSGRVDPLSLSGRLRTKPVVMGVQGYCFTIGIELLLACDIRLAAEDTVFGQIEIKRGIFPFGGATVRLPQVAGWGNAMRYLLTGDRFDAPEAHRIGLVQDVVADVHARSIELAQCVAAQAPLGVQATLSSSRTMLREGEAAAIDALLPEARRLMETEDAAEGLRSFSERRDGIFEGR